MDVHAQQHAESVGQNVALAAKRLLASVYGPRNTFLSLSASLSARATIVNVGFALPPVGKIELPATYKFETV